MAFVPAGKDVSIARNITTGKWDFVRDSSGNFQMSNDLSHKVLGLLLEYRGKWWADSSGKRGSDLYTLKNVKRITPSEAQGMAQAALQPLIDSGEVLSVTCVGKRIAQGISLDVSWLLPGGQTITLQPSLSW